MAQTFQMDFYPWYYLDEAESQAPSVASPFEGTSELYTIHVDNAYLDVELIFKPHRWQAQLEAFNHFKFRKRNGSFTAPSVARPIGGTVFEPMKKSEYPLRRIEVRIWETGSSRHLKLTQSEGFITEFSH